MTDLIATCTATDTVTLICTEWTFSGSVDANSTEGTFLFLGLAVALLAAICMAVVIRRR